MSVLSLAKYHGLGNDFLVVDGTLAEPGLSWSEVARRLCDRRYGVGADGLIVALPGSGRADLTMLLHNADGSAAEMSGNGIRCLALFARDSGLVGKDEFVVATEAGTRQVRVGPISATGRATVRVDMGRVEVDERELEVADPAGGASWRGRAVDVGNPHLVLIAEQLDDLDLPVIGPALEASRPGGVNVEWVRERPGTDELDLRVWERGAGLTLACGTGSVAAAAAGMTMGLVGGPVVSVHNPGGTLEVDCSEDSIWLVGPAQRVARVEADLDLDFGQVNLAPDERGELAQQGASEPDWAVVAEGAVEWGWDWATGPGWGSPKG